MLGVLADRGGGGSEMYGARLAVSWTGVAGTVTLSRSERTFVSPLGSLFISGVAEPIATMALSAAAFIILQCLYGA